MRAKDWRPYGRSQGEVGFEVRILQGDTWQIHARYSNAKQRTAVEDDKSLEKISTIKAVKVVRETYNEETGLTNEFDIYKSPSLIEQQKRESEERRAKQPAASPSPSAAAQRRARTDAKPKRAAKTAKPKRGADKGSSAASRDRKSGQKKSLFSGIIKLLLVVMVSIVLAVLVMLLAEFFMDQNRSLGARISAGARSNILIGVFVVAFLLSAFSMVSAFIKKGDLDNSLDRRRQPAQPPAPAERPKPAAPVAQAAPAADEAPPIAESPSRR